MLSPASPYLRVELVPGRRTHEGICKSLVDPRFSHTFIVHSNPPPEPARVGAVHGQTLMAAIGVRDVQGGFEPVVSFYRPTPREGDLLAFGRHRWIREMFTRSRYIPKPILLIGSFRIFVAYAAPPRDQRFIEGLTGEVNRFCVRNFRGSLSNAIQARSDV